MTRLLDIANNVSILTIALVATAVLLLVAASWRARRKRARALRGELPPLVFTVHDRTVPDMRPGVFHAPAVSANGSAHSPATPPAPSIFPQPPRAVPPDEPQSHPHPGGPGSHTVDGAGDERGAGAQPTVRRDPHATASEVTMRVPRYTEQAPLEYLPGRLEVQTGGDTGRKPGEEIRLPRGRGKDATIILGRDDGPPDSHLTLSAESVSRRHARMQYEDGRWKITNLSRTNPTVVNGEELMVAEGARWLYDGDVIEMGEVVFRFHER